MKQLEAYRMNRLIIMVREKNTPGSDTHVATATNDKSCQLVLDTMNLAFGLMETMPDRAEGITLQ